MQLLPTAVYLLCFAGSAFCAILLIRSYRYSRTRLLFWTALSFAALAANNLLLLVDLVFLPKVNLLAFRQLSSLAAIAVLLYGFIFETE